ncbi:MAG: hypothetical protein RL235_1115 [Chlamydiota bacterium]|jgi:DNA repair exonuclease SbcCD ATPase subunit
MTAPAPESSPETAVSRDSQPQETWSSAFKEFNTKLETLPTSEEKIDCGLHFMRSAISQEGSPRFREFWESRRLVLPLFRGNINPAIRSRLWNDFVELTVEARRLKEILEEQSAFAIEQIDLAIQAIETDLQKFDELLAQSGVVSELESSRVIAEKAEEYNKLQMELNLLNALASRLNSLRREVIRTEMRIRFKTKFFKKLSELGDQIFPKRKELLDKVSSAFESDVSGFVQTYFGPNKETSVPYYVLRDEIKALQGMAKVLTLSSSAFSKTRLQLSECWDLLREEEKEYKKVQFEKRQASSEQRIALQAQIDALKAKSAELDLRALDREIDDIVREMRSIPMDRDDVRFLRDELAGLRAPHLSAQETRAKELEEAEREKLRVKREQVQKLKDAIATLMQKAPELSVEDLSEQYAALLRDMGQLGLSKIEKQQFERSMRPIKDAIADKKEHTLLNLSDDDRKTLDNLRSVLQQRKERRQEVKEHVEALRKSLGASNLDFEKAMHTQELLEQERERLDKANAAIEEIEEKIDELEGQ